MYYNSMLPQAGFNQMQEKVQDYLLDSMDLNVNYFNSAVESVDKFSGKVFTTYFNKIKNVVESSNENAKEVIRTGKF